MRTLISDTDTRIGRLANGNCYVYKYGRDKPPFVGSLSQVKLALHVIDQRKNHPENAPMFS